MNEYYFHLDHLTVGYDKKPLIKDICIGIEKGEIVTLIGPNGSGKSTILKSITRQEMWSLTGKTCMSFRSASCPRRWPLC